MMLVFYKLWEDIGFWQLLDHQWKHYIEDLVQITNDDTWPEL